MSQTPPRRISEFLPEVLQTDVLQKFFAATADHMFQPAHVEHINAYVGSLLGTFDPNLDAQVPEPDQIRNNYQVSPAVISRNTQSGQITHVCTYDDLINKLRVQGALVDDHNRLFAGSYYSFGLPIDWDKFVNYTQYVWLPAGPRLIQILATTDITQIQSGATFTLAGAWQLEGSDQVEQGITLSTGMRVQFTQDQNVQIRLVTYVVEGVGRAIRLVPDQVQVRLAWDNPAQWDSTVWDTNTLYDAPSYVTLGRGSANGNPWSKQNRWFHKQILEFTQTDMPANTQYQAQRPILEFDYSMKLWDFGTQYLTDVNMVISDAISLDQVQGASNVILDQVPLDDGQVILFTNLRDPQNPNLIDTANNNRLYQVHNVRVDGVVKLNQLQPHANTNGLAQPGDVIHVTQGSSQNMDTYWYYTGNSWKQGQSRQILPEWSTQSVQFVQAQNQSPLFELFDSTGISLADPVNYPQSDFAGCTIVDYTTNPAMPVDSLLGRRVDVDMSSARNYKFDVTCVQLEVRYMEGLDLQVVPGYYYWQQNVINQPEYLNNWFMSATDTKQFVQNEYVADGTQSVFDIDQTPVQIQVQVGTQLLTADQFEVTARTVKLNQVPAPQQVIKVKTWAGLSNQTQSGYFEIPVNLQNNADNAQVTQFKISDILPHAHSVIQSQSTFEGDVQGSNNYRDTAQDLSVGTQILQHDASMIKLMALNATDQSQVLEGIESLTDPYVAMTWSQQEYLRFYNKFVNTLFGLFNNQALTAAQSPEFWMQQALKQINVGKIKTGTWANSGIEQQAGAYCSRASENPTWVPTSASRLGAWSMYTPEVFYDTSQPMDPQTGEAPLTLRCHNGALLVLKGFDNQNLGQIVGNRVITQNPEQLSHPVSRAWLYFEQQQYASAPSQYTQVDHVPALDARTIFSGKFRKTTYSRTDLLQLQSGNWQRWLTVNQIDALRNTTFNIQDPFSWNYSGCVDAQGEAVPGHYRGIYYYFYDTDTPHTHPWHMLGFSQKPTWWDSEYGAAPYTSGNLKLWQDLELGRIAQGARAGMHVTWARPGLHAYIPVNSAGELLAPFDVGVVTQLPSQAQAAADWQFGDRSPLEHVWLTTADVDQAWAQWAYLARPAAFIEYLWDGVKRVKLFPTQTYSQLVHLDSLTRKQVQDQIMHRENPSLIQSLNLTATYEGSCGIQHWISEKLISDSRNVTAFLGDLIRGSDVNLAHKMGGFTDGDNLRVLVDSFGLSNTENLLLPQEDVTCQLLRSASTQEYVYTGVLVEFLGRNTGYRVIGYDVKAPYFEIIPSLVTGTKQTVVIENQQVTEYKQGQNIVIQVPYGTVFESRAQVYDFLISLGRAQQAQGWQFDEYDETSGKTRTWSLSAREFLYWSQGPWAPGTYITLSPLATLAKFETDFGIIQHIGGLVSGTHSVIDRLGNQIALVNLDFLRIEDSISVKVLNDQGIYGLRLYTTSLEHALIFNNRTVFDDLIYDPIFNQRQQRFKLFGYRTLNWKGRLQAPGYLVTQSMSDQGNLLRIQNRIIPNLEKSVDDLRRIFEIDLSVPVNNLTSSSSISQSMPDQLQLLANHQIGYQPRAYLTGLLLENSAEFQFYQGMIKQKGTSASIAALLRNTQVIEPDQEFFYYEQWAFRRAQYGYEQDLNQLDIRLIQDQVTSDPQLVQLLSDSDSDPLSDNQITIVGTDYRIVNKTDQLNKFKLRDRYGAYDQDLPTAGPVLESEVTWQVVNRSELTQLFKQRINLLNTDSSAQQLQPGQRVWQFIDPQKGWNVYKLSVCAWQIVSTNPNQVDRTYTTVNTSADHGLREGDLVILFGVVNAGVNINDTFEVINVWDSRSFDIDLTTNNTGNGGTAWCYFSVRFPDQISRDRAIPPQPWQRGDLVWCDGDAFTPWQVFVSSGRTWFEIRTETYKTDPTHVLNSRLYDIQSLLTLQHLSLWDPVKNKIPGILDNEITYKTPYDPAKYTQDPSGTFGVNASQAWGAPQVGQVWWDLSTTRFLDYETGTDSERRQNWGRIAPGTTIDIYEWVRSPVPPTSWQNLVNSNADLQSIGSPGAATGQVKSATSAFVTDQRITDSGQSQTIYYFWVQNKTTVPELPHRTLSVSVIAQSLQSANNLNQAWWAPINDQAVLVSNVSVYLSGDQTVWQTQWLTNLDVHNVHEEYDIVAQDDPRAAPPAWLWHKLGESLVEYDSFGNPLPDPRLRPMQQLGVQIRPRQNIFKHVNQARRAVVQTVNQFLVNSDTPVVQDPGRQNWLPYFLSEDPEPEPRNVFTPVRLASTQNVAGYLTVNNTPDLTEFVGDAPGWLELDGVITQLNDRVLLKNQTHAEQNGIWDVINPGAQPVTQDVPGQFQDSQLELNATGTWQLNGTDVPVGAQVWLQNQTMTTQNGVYVLIAQGTSTSGAQLFQLYNSAQVQDDPGLTHGVLRRSADFDVPDFSWIQAQVHVLQGVTQAGTTWHQTQDAILVINQDPIVWQAGVSEPLYVDRVDNMGQLAQLSNTLALGSQVLVGADVTNKNKWTIWRWSEIVPGQNDWQLVRHQTFRTAACWEYTDWYATGYSDAQIPKWEFDTLQQRDASTQVQLGDLVKVINTGNNTWAWYERQDLEGVTYRLVAQQLGNIQLSDNLWDYARFGLGFDSAGFGQEILGAEHDTRLEFEQIWKGLWVGAQGTQGLLKIDSDQNETNLLLFVLINHVFSEQTFVDWAFKTSFIHLRGFAEVLQATQLYRTNKINSLIEYVNEVKPYHVKLNQFVDWRKVNDTFRANFTDFDKPVFEDASLGIRVLNEQIVSDQVILSTNPTYTAWYQNHVLNPELIRTIRVRMFWDRVACASGMERVTDYQGDLIADLQCNSLSEWLNAILNPQIPLGTLVQVKAPGQMLIQRNQVQGAQLQNWDILTWGLDYTGEISDSVYDVQSVLDLIQTTPPTGYTVKVYVDLLQQSAWFVKEHNTGAESDYRMVAWVKDSHAAQRIQDYYVPGVGQPAIHDPGLISGCESKLTSVSGKQFQTQDAWDLNEWDNVNGWDHDQTMESDISWNSGGSLKYQVFVGDGVTTTFELRVAPQEPHTLQVWVNGMPQVTPQNWIIKNQISQVYVNNPGLGYNVNQILQLQGGQFTHAARFQITQVSPLGAILQLQILEVGEYLVTPLPDILNVQGGTGVNATVTVRWTGTQLTFVQAPGTPTQPRPNIWVIEKGQTFNPMLASLLDTTLDGGDLNRPHLEGDHPEELVPVWARNQLCMDVYTAGTAGHAPMQEQVFVSDGVRYTFPLLGPILSDQQVWVWLNGELQTVGVNADYVINYQYFLIQFVNAPAPGEIVIQQLGWGGASEGLGSVMIANPGSGYNLFDVVQLSGGVPATQQALVQVVAVKAVSTQIVSGGVNHAVGDKLYYRVGVGSETLVLRVTQVQNVNNNRGVITAVEIEQAGYYTDLSVGVHEWYSSGSGTQTQIVPVWSVAQVFVVNRGIYLQTSATYTHVNALPNTGTGLSITATPAHIRQQVILQADGVTQTIQLQDPTNQNAIVVTFNGVPTGDWGVDSNDRRVIILRFVPQVGDTVVVQVYASQLFSLRRTQLLNLNLPELNYVLDNPPIYSVAQSLNSQVFVNGILLKAPEHVRLTGTGSQTVFDLSFLVTNAADLKVWQNNLLVAPFTYTVISAGTQIEFEDAPLPDTDILIQHVNSVNPTHEFQIQGDRVQFEPGVLDASDQVQVVTFTEDSSMRWNKDTFMGVQPGLFTLTNVPTSFGTVQVYVNGRRQNSQWDYTFVQAGTFVQVKFSDLISLTNTDVVTIYYLTSAAAIPPVAFRMFENIYGDVNYYRISDARKTQLSETLTWSQTHAWVDNGLVLPPASHTQPGQVWINAEQMEYTQIEPDPTPNKPLRHKLSGIRRGSGGTATGVFNKMDSTFQSGDGITRLFITKFENPLVKVNDVFKHVGVHYDLIQNPVGVIPGTYVQFRSDHVPPPGARNIQFMKIVFSIQQDVSHESGSLVQDISINQQIPGGIIWPSGDQGIQRSPEPQTAFLIAEPGTRSGIK